MQEAKIQGLSPKQVEELDDARKHWRGFSTTHVNMREPWSSSIRFS